MPAGVVFGESTLPGSQMALIPFTGTAPSGPSQLLKAHPSVPSHWGSGLQHPDLGEQTGRAGGLVGA